MTVPRAQGRRGSVKLVLARQNASREGVERVHRIECLVSCAVHPSCFFERTKQRVSAREGQNNQPKVGVHYVDL